MLAYGYFSAVVETGVGPELAVGAGAGAAVEDGAVEEGAGAVVGAAVGMTVKVGVEVGVETAAAEVCAKTPPPVEVGGATAWMDEGVLDAFGAVVEDGAGATALLGATYVADGAAAEEAGAEEEPDPPEEPPLVTVPVRVPIVF